jgi:alcohol dehydrogenase
VIVHEIDQEADIAIDAYGSAETADASVRSLRRGGRHVQVGLMLGDDARAPLPWDLVVARELHVVGSHGMAAVDYPPMLDLVARGRLDPARLVGSVIPLEAVGVALTTMDSPIPGHAGITVATREA